MEVLKRKQIYLDFSVWAPHAERNAPRRKFLGMVPGPGGTLQNVEQHGPGCFDDWVGSYDVFRTVAISKNTIDPRGAR